MIPDRGDSAYLYTEVTEQNLFAPRHLNAITEFIGASSSKIDGVCISVVSNHEYGKNYKLYLPIVHVEDSYYTIQTLRARFKVAISELTEQMKQNHTLH